MNRLTHLALLFLLLAPALKAQEDTLRVQTLTFDMITQRKGWWVFPDSTHSYRKVLMHHTLKCDAQTTQDQFACGEWDYLTYSFVHDHTGVMDSAALTHPWFMVGSQAPASLELVEQPVLDQQQVLVNGVALVGTTTEELYAVGAGDAEDSALLGSSGQGIRSQYLFTADELLATGLVAGPIHQLRFSTSEAGGGPVQRLSIRLKHGPAALSGMDNVGLQLVYDGVPGSVGSEAGEHVLQLAQAFVWDGVSNVLVDIACVGGAGSTAVVASTTAPGLAMQDAGPDGYLGLMNDHLSAPAAPFVALNGQISIVFKARGDASLPLNTSLLEATNAQGQRVLNIHLPWSNNRIYWDAGNVGGAYDRIDKAATESDVEGQWNHWAFVKNSSTGSMKIYLNGVLWHSGNGMTRPMTGITTFRIGSSATNGNNYAGHLDELNIFASELDAATIAAWKDRKVDGSHPQAASLLYSYHFDEPTTSFTAINSAVAGADAMLMGSVQRLAHAATDLGAAATGSAQRADLVFGRGEYVVEPSTTLITVPVPRPGITQQYFAVQGNVVSPMDTIHGWEGGMSYTYTPGGEAIDPVPVGGTIVVNDTLNYFGVPFEVINDYEVGRFITPYGINLSLGPNGFRWTYDVTDYQWLLRDSVEFSAGNQQELINVAFELIEGTPPRPLIRQQRPWGPQRSYSYAGLGSDQQLAPVTVDLHPDASQWTMRTRLTGHGHASNTGSYPHCCEWKDNSHFLVVNGTLADEWHIWQANECALNPVYPQGGTWLGAREGWCPGDVVKDHVVDLTPHIAGSTATLDYAITPVPANNAGMGSGNYVVNMDLLEHAAPAYQLDAEVYEVKRPSKADYFRRENPICHDPLVVLRNAGAQDLTSVNFTYGVSGGATQTHTWTGQLAPMATVEVLLPVGDGSFWYGDEQRQFTVSVSAPNGGQDQHAANDSYRSNFDLPVVYSDHIIMDYRTNNRPHQNTVTVRDVHGNIKFQRGVHTANTVYRDTLALYDGCYTLEVMDTGNDGLSYWADSQQGTGYFRFRRMNNSILKTFQPEFGRSIHWAFVIGGLVGMNEVESTLHAVAYPNPGNGNFTLQLSGLTGRTEVTVLDASGRLLGTRQVELFGEDRIAVDLSMHAPGIYMLRVVAAEQSALLRLVNQ